MIANFDDFLGSHRAAMATLMQPVDPEAAAAVSAALRVCEEARDCLIRASRAVSGLCRLAGEALDLARVEELRRLLAMLWEGRELVEERIDLLRRFPGGPLAQTS